MEELFITKIHIQEVRHLKDFDIPLSETERKHLILTGRNGSGKTSVLEALNAQLSLTKAAFQPENFAKVHFLPDSVPINGLDPLKWEAFRHQSGKELDNQFSVPWDKVKGKFNDDLFTLLFFPARRNPEYETPTVIEKVTDFRGEKFLVYLLMLTADRAFALEEKDPEVARKSGDWLENFKITLRELFNDPKLEFDFNRKDYHYYLKQEGKNPIHFNQLPDGFASIIQILSELIMCMEKTGKRPTEVQGIVLIDEIETHLHIDLQKRVLKFLTDFFPRIQFIVTTHSPFVLNSISNAVVFDLEKKEPIEDLSGYSYKAIVENYFGADQYSQTIKEKLSRYEILLALEMPTPEEMDELERLGAYLEGIPKQNSEGLAGKLQQLRIRYFKKAV